MQNDEEIPTVQHRGEERSNALRRRIAQVEPKALRTFTPSLAVIARSAGCYHWTPEGRMLADFTSGVLVANLGHNPTRWWLRTLEYLGLSNLHDGAPFHPAAPLTAYNAVTELELRASERLIETLQGKLGARVANKSYGRPAAARRFKKPYGRPSIIGPARIESLQRGTASMAKRG